MSANNAAFRRQNPLTGEWVLVSPHRNNRPWSGALETEIASNIPEYSADCPLCPSNTRVNGEKNPDYEHCFVFTNDFAALTEHAAEDADTSVLFRQQKAQGLAKVICFSPSHNKSLPRLTEKEMQAVVNEWRTQYALLSSQFACVQIFENKGEVMGCSQPHPHGQIWAHHHLSTELEKENEHQLRYFEQHKRAMLQDYVEQELAFKERIVLQNDDWIVLVPFWAKWPFETLLVSKHAIADFSALDDAQSHSLAHIIKQLTIKYDNIFNCSFPYSMGWHNAPANLSDKQHWILHAHFYPPLLRSPTIKKHMVGYEMLGESQRDLSPEQAAEILRDCSNIHYMDES